MGCAGSKSDDVGGGGGGGGGQGGYDDQGQEDDYNPLTQDEVNARIQCSDGTITYKLGETGITLRYAYLSQRGYYPEDLDKHNQDQHVEVEGRKDLRRMSHLNPPQRHLPLLLHVCGRLRTQSRAPQRGMRGG